MVQANLILFNKALSYWMTIIDKYIYRSKLLEAKIQISIETLFLHSKKTPCFGKGNRRHLT